MANFGVLYIFERRRGALGNLPPTPDLDGSASVRACLVNSGGLYVCYSGVVAKRGGTAPPINFGLSAIFFTSENFCSKMQTLGLKTVILKI